jgi:hypothetical protein
MDIHQATQSAPPTKSELLQHMSTTISQEDLQSLKSLITHSHLKTDPQQLLVYEDRNMLFDSDRLRPSIREEVMDKFPQFGSKKPLTLGYQYGPPGVVADKLRPYKSLTSRLSAHAFAEIDKMESDLVLGAYLSHGKRARYKASLQLLRDGTRTVWENWIHSLNAHQMAQIDHEIRAWLKEPINWDEEDLFKQDWKDPFYGVQTVNKLFERFHPLVLEFLGVDNKSFEIRREPKPLPLCVLKIPIKDANARAKSLGLKFHFKAW